MTLRTVAGELASALRFLTVVPVPVASTSFGAATFPLAGLLIGAAAAIVDSGLGRFFAVWQNLGTVAFLAVLSGGLHHDGLADTFDALGGVTVEERLRILRDGAIGTFGALALVLMLAAKIVALGALAGNDRVRALVLAPALGRFAMLVAAFRARPARSDGVGREFVVAVDARALALAMGISVLSAAILWNGRGLLAFSGSIAAAAAIRGLAVRRFGGITGDVFGASGEIAETLVIGLLCRIHP